MSSAGTFIIPISNGILAPRHREAIGSAIWLFLWMVDKTTKEQLAPDGKGFEGLVLGGMPITTDYIAEQTGESQRSVHNHLNQLERGGYIRRIENKGMASGYAVKKSKKFHRVRAAVMSHSEEISEREPLQKAAEVGSEPSPKIAEGSAKNGEGVCNFFPRNKEDIPKTIHREDSKPVRAKKQRAAVDPRRADFIEDFKKFHDFKNPGIPFHFGAKDGKNLNDWLKDNRDIERPDWQEILNNRAKSPGKDEPNGIDHAAELWTWIGKARRYLNGPKDRYGNPVTRKAGANGHQQNKTAVIANNITAALEQRRARRMAGAAPCHSPERVSEPAADRGSERDISLGVGELIPAGRG